MCPRIQPHELKARSTYGEIAGASLIDWPISFDELEPYYVRAEDKMGGTGRHGIRLQPGSNNFKVMERGAKRVGYRDYDTNNMAINVEPRDGRNAFDQIGFCMQGCRSGAKWSTANAEIPKAEGTGRCEVRAECMVLRIEHDEAGRASGVLYADRDCREHRQKARIVCVAGNAIETARLLLNSESSRFPDGLANASGHVGCHYMRHMAAFAYGEFEQPVNMYRGIVVGGIIRDEVGHDPARGFAGGFNMGTLALGFPFYAAFLNPNGWGASYGSWIEAYGHTAGLQMLGEDLPMAHNRVSLHGSEKDQHGLPIPSLHLDEHDNEIGMENYAYTKGVALLEAAGAKRVFESPPLPASHNLGTCRMSEKAADGVVNRWGQAHDIANLFISDGSQFTTSAAANPTLTIVALAIRQADYLAEAMRGNEIPAYP